MHVDQFIESRKTDEYASWFFHLHRLPAMMQMKFSDLIKDYQLFCDHKGEHYRVTGASRLGDVWLTKDFNQSAGYQLRVDVSDCQNFSREFSIRRS